MRNHVLIIIAVSIIILRFLFLNNSPSQSLAQYTGKQITFNGSVMESPDERDSSVRYTVQIENSSDKILLVSNRFPAYDYGDKIQVSGKLELPKNFQTDQGINFDYVHYLSKDRIYFLIYQPGIKKISSGGNFLFKNLYKFENYFASRISRVVPEPNSSLIGGLIFGAKQQIGQDLLNKMKEVGVIHIVAISGYNVTIIATAILSLTSYLRRRKLGLILSAVSIILFAMMVGLGSTVIRASIMALIAIWARYLGRPNEALRALFVAVFLMLIWNPLLLIYDPSFQLSVMATLGLILFSPIISNSISNSKSRKYFSFLSKIPEKFGIREIVSSTFAVQIFLLPLLIRLSGIFSPISFIVNLIVLPIIPTTMLLGFFTGFLGLLPFLGLILSWPFGAVSYLLTEFIIQVVTLADKIPLAFLQVGSLPIWLLIIWYGFYAWAFWKLSSIADQFRLEKKSST